LINLAEEKELTEAQKQVAKYEVFYAGTKIYMGKPVEKPKVYITPEGEVREYGVPVTKEEALPTLAEPVKEPVKEELPPGATPIYHGGKLVGYDDPVGQMTYYFEGKSPWETFVTAPPKPITITPTEPTFRPTLPLGEQVTVGITPTIKLWKDVEEERKAQALAEKIWTEAKPVEKVGLGLHTLFSPKGYELMASVDLPITGAVTSTFLSFPVKKPEQVIKERIFELETKPTGEAVVESVLFSPPSEIAMSYGAGVGLGIAAAKIPALTTRVGKIGLTTVGAVGLGVRGAEIGSLVLAGEPEKAKGKAMVTGLSAIAGILGYKQAYKFYSKPYEVEYLRGVKREKLRTAEIRKGMSQIERTDILGKRDYKFTTEMSRKEILALKKKGVLFDITKRKEIPPFTMEKRAAEQYFIDTYKQFQRTEPKAEEWFSFVGRGKKVLTRYYGKERIGMALGTGEILKPVKVFEPPKEPLGGLLRTDIGGITKEISYTMPVLGYVEKGVTPAFFIPTLPREKRKVPGEIVAPTLEVVKRKGRRVTPITRLVGITKVEEKPLQLVSPIQRPTQIITPTQIVSPTQARRQISKELQKQLRVSKQLMKAREEPSRRLPLPPLLIPPLPGFPGEPRIGRRKKPKRRYEYRPSVAGIMVGRPIKKPPKRLTGMGIRPPVISRTRDVLGLGSFRIKGGSTKWGKRGRKKRRRRNSII